jgi:hypothetical protein
VHENANGLIVEGATMFDDDRDFLRAFEAASIPAADWTHAEHVRMAYLYLRDLPFGDARIRDGIKALLAAQGHVPTPTSGYHETITVAWAHLIAAAVAWQPQVPGAGFASFAAAHPHLLAKTLLRLYYTKDRGSSAEARTTFVAPDIAPLPSP